MNPEIEELELIDMLKQGIISRAEFKVMEKEAAGMIQCPNCSEYFEPKGSKICKPCSDYELGNEQLTIEIPQNLKMAM